MVLIDSNVIIDIFGDDSEWRRWSVDRATEAMHAGGLAINPIIYSEVAAGFRRIEALESDLRILGTHMAEVPRAGLFLAAQQFRLFRSRSARESGMLLPDFLIGAHAAVLGIPLLTRDMRRYRTYFPTVELITPEQ